MSCHRALRHDCRHSDSVCRDLWSDPSSCMTSAVCLFAEANRGKALPRCNINLSLARLRLPCWQKVWSMRLGANYCQHLRGNSVRALQTLYSISYFFEGFVLSSLPDWPATMHVLSLMTREYIFYIAEGFHGGRRWSQDFVTFCFILWEPREDKFNGRRQGSLIVSYYIHISVSYTGSLKGSGWSFPWKRQFPPGIDLVPWTYSNT